MVFRSPARLSCYARGFRLAALPMSKHRTMTDELTVHPLMYLPKNCEKEICNGPVRRRCL